MEFYILEVKNDYNVEDEFVNYCLNKHFIKLYYNKYAEYMSYYFKFDVYSVETENDLMYLDDLFNYYDNDFFPNMILYNDLYFNNFIFNNDVTITLNNEIFISNPKYDKLILS